MTNNPHKPLTQLHSTIDSASESYWATKQITKLDTVHKMVIYIYIYIYMGMSQNTVPNPGCWTRGYDSGYDSWVLRYIYIYYIYNSWNQWFYRSEDVDLWKFPTLRTLQLRSWCTIEAADTQLQGYAAKAWNKHGTNMEQTHLIKSFKTYFILVLSWQFAGHAFFFGIFFSNRFLEWLPVPLFGPGILKDRAKMWAKMPERPNHPGQGTRANWSNAAILAKKHVFLHPFILNTNHKPWFSLCF
jgi:hypothetical protein